MKGRQDSQRRRGLIIGAGAGAMFASAFLPWIGGSLRREPGYRLANLVLTVHAPLHGAPAWLVAADLYAVPVAGVVAWLLLVLRGPTRFPPVAGVVLGGLGCFALVIAVPFLPNDALFSLGLGVYLAAAGSAAVLLSAWA